MADLRSTTRRISTRTRSCGRSEAGFTRWRIYEVGANSARPGIRRACAIKAECVRRFYCCRRVADPEQVHQSFEAIDSWREQRRAAGWGSADSASGTVPGGDLLASIAGHAAL